MVEMDPGRDPWLDKEAERRTLDYGGSFPNPQNSRTRADTFGIRPDLFDTLNEAMTKKETVEDLLRQARERQQEAAMALRDSQAAREKSDKALAESDKAVQRATDAQGQAKAAVDASNSALDDAAAARADSKQSLQNSKDSLQNSQDALRDASDARSRALSAESDAASARTDANQAVSDSRAAIGKAEEADLASEEGRKVAIAANTAAIDSTSKAVVALTQASAANSRAIDAVSASSAANSRAISASNKAIEANSSAVEASLAANQANSTAIKSTNNAVNALTIATEANSTAISSTNKAVAALRAASSANSSAIQSVTQASEANTRALELMRLQNHGSWYIGDSYVLEANTWLILNFNQSQGIIRNCSSTAVGEGRGIRLLEKGDWEIRLRVTLPPGNTVIGTSTAIRITVMPALGGTNIGRSKTSSFNQGWDETLTCSIVTSIPESGCYVYAEAFASTKSGANDWWPASTGSELTEFTARQLSY
nr:MAG TPA: hypothetical protein [Caudoviricetes sp.]